MVQVIILIIIKPKNQNLKTYKVIYSKSNENDKLTNTAVGETFKGRLEKHWRGKEIVGYTSKRKTFILGDIVGKAHCQRPGFNPHLG